MSTLQKRLMSMKWRLSISDASPMYDQSNCSYGCVLTVLLIRPQPNLIHTQTIKLHVLCLDIHRNHHPSFRLPAQSILPIPSAKPQISKPRQPPCKPHYHGTPSSTYSPILLRSSTRLRSSVLIAQLAILLIQPLSLLLQIF